MGYEIGEWHTRFDKLVAYFEKLAETSDMAEFQTLGPTNQLRPLVVLAINNQNIQNLENIRTNHIKLADPNQAIRMSVPAIINLAYSVHEMNLQVEKQHPYSLLVVGFPK